MLSKEKSAAMKYLKREFDNLQNDPILSLGCTVGLVNNDIFHWKISLMGPADTPYAGGMFFLTADFQDKYPDVKPEVSNGHICISTLNSWKPKTPMVDVISAIFALFYSQNPGSPYDGKMAREYESNRAEFNRKAKEWTLKYASMNA